MRMKLLYLCSALALGGCTTSGIDRGPAAGPVEVKIIGFNDFHGNLEPPKLAVDHPAPGDGAIKVPAGGAAYLATAIDALRRENPNNLVISAGDMIGASPLVSALFLDEPTVAAMNLIKIDYNAVGNHEFDRGRAELLRMQNGGCEKHTTRIPCAVEPFKGASFGFLTANTITESGETFLPGHAIRSFGKGARQVKVAIVGLTLREVPSLVTPSGVAGLEFRDEAEAVNALLPRLRAEGADAIVLLIHQGVYSRLGYDDQSCGGIEGDLTKILDRLDPGVDLVVSGHTHNAYVCDYGRINPARPILLTSAGRYGTLVTDITLGIDPAAGKVVRKTATNRIVQGEGFSTSKEEAPLTAAVPSFDPHPAVAALVSRYAAAAKPVAARPVGKLSAPALKTGDDDHEGALANLIADSQLAATRSGPAAARVALMNPRGVRADLVPGPDGSISFGQLFAAQPFANLIIVKSLTGRQLKAVLEQQFASGSNTAQDPNILAPSHNMRFSYDLSRPAGSRIVDIRIDGQAVREDEVYRVAMNSFLSGGGDNFTAFRDGTDPAGSMLDLDALEAYLSRTGTVTPPALGRVQDRTPRS